MKACSLNGSLIRTCLGERQEGKEHRGIWKNLCLSEKTLDKSLAEPHRWDTLTPQMIRVSHCFSSSAPSISSNTSATNLVSSVSEYPSASNQLFQALW